VPSSVITLTFDPPVSRWVLLLPALLALVCALFAVRWYIGNTIAEYAPPPEQDGTEMAKMAARWAPGDPLTHWRLAFFQEKNFSAENIAAAVREYQAAVIAAPYDYRYWMELGRALEASGDRAGGEKALRRAVELAPAYSHPRWFYGNLLLRQDRLDEAFAQLSQAADVDPLMQPQVFAVVTQVFGDDVDKMVAALRSPAVRMQFAISLISANKFEEAARMLRSVSAADRKANPEMSEQVMKTLIERKHFRAALAMMRETESDSSQLPASEKVPNGGFEESIQQLDTRPFHWVVNSRPQAQLATDSQAHSGSKSLRMQFRAANKLDSIPVTQTIIVEPDTSYRLQFYIRTQDLVSGATPFVNVTDATDGQLLVSSPPAETGTNDWKLVTMDFKTKPKNDGISISFARPACLENAELCPIFGIVWYDDFSLQPRQGGAPGSATASPGNNGR
jgi:tetratricopeptide (TPR) repeat protein